MAYRRYEIKPLVVNFKTVSLVVIDEHVDKHSEHIDDLLILKIVDDLDNQNFLPVQEKDSFQYFTSKIKTNGKWYKLVWLLEKDLCYIGIITVFRDRRIK